MTISIKTVVLLSLLLVPHVANADSHCPVVDDMLGQNPNATPKTVILFVPGFTINLLGGSTDGQKDGYFESQRNDLASAYEVVYMNDCNNFDSDRELIQSNANAIAGVLEAISSRPAFTPVIIVSHSKGGQDTLQALVKLDNEEDLLYRNPADVQIPGNPSNRTLWDNVEGWVAYTSNFFESPFPIDNESVFVLDLKVCSRFEIGECFSEPEKVCPPDFCPSRYADYLVVPGEERQTRQQYMSDHQDAIAELVECVPTISAVASYVPEFFGSGLLDGRNRVIRKRSRDHEPGELCGANDGVLPVRAGQLPGANLRSLRTDTANGEGACGVDHKAPAEAVNDFLFNQYWSDGFRNSETRRYINEVDAVPEFPTAEAGPDQTLECESHEGSSVMLDGTNSTSGSPSFPRGIATHEWFENGQPIATGSNPTLTLPLGMHQITLRVTDNCWVIDEDQVVVIVQDTLPPEIDLEVDPATLWPPNHKLELVADGVSAADVCDPNPTLLATVTSNEPINGHGDGNTEPDWKVDENADGTLDVSVRAERSGVGQGRAYQITATAIDGSGNSDMEQASATVAHNQRGR